MKRLLLALVLALALVAAACGGSDGDGQGAATDDGAAQDADGGSDDQGADGTDGEGTDGDGTDGEGTDGDGTDGTDGDGTDDDGTDDDGTDGSGDAAPRSGLAGAIYSLIVNDPDFDSAEFSEQQAACVANGAVDEVGEDRLNSYGINEDTVGDVALDDIEFEEDDADAMAEVFVECADMLAVFQEGLGSGEAAEQECIADAITEDAMVEFLSLGFQGREDESVGVLMSAASGCIDIGGDGGLDIPQGDSVDEVMFEMLVESLALDDTQVACIEEQLENGLSIQTDIATITINCNLA